MAIRKIVSRSIGVDVIAAEDLANNSVTAAEISDGAVTVNKIGSGAVTTDKIGSGAVTSAKIDSTSTGMSLADLAVDTDTLYVDATNNRVGVGISSPAKDFTLGVLKSMRLQTGSTTYDVTPTSGGIDQLVFNSSLDTFYEFKMGGTTKASISTNGITFNGDTAAANALNDYEEGTWDCTPSTSSSSLSPLSGWTLQATGYYTKVGQLVTCSYIFEWSNTNASSGSVHMILPFQVKGNNHWTGCGTETSNVNFPTGVSYITVRPETNGVHASFKGCGDSLSRSDMRFSDFGSIGSGYALGTFSYFTDS